MTVEELSLTEAAVICGWAEGLRDEEIAGRLELALSTLHQLTVSIYRRLGVRTRAGAVGAWERYKREIPVVVPGAYDSDDLDRMVKP